MSLQRRIVYLGAGGPFGTTMTDELLKAGWHVVILARNPSAVSPRDNTTIVKYTPNDRTALVAAMQGAEVVLCSTNGRNPDGFAFQKPLIDAAIEAGVKRYIPCEYASDLEHSKIQANPIYQSRHALLKYVKDKAEKGAIQYTVFHTGAFLEMGLKSSFLKIDVKARQAAIQDGGNDPAVHVSYLTCARATIRALSVEHFAATANRAIRTGDAMLSQNQLLALVEKAAGVEFAVTNELSTDNFRRGLEKVTAGETSFEAIRDLMIANFYTKDGSCVWGVGDNEWLGVETQSVEEVVAKGLFYLETPESQRNRVP